MDGVNQNGNAGAEPGAPPCHDDACITCSGQAVSSRVIELGEMGIALVDAGPGDTVLVHAGEAIAVVARV